MPNKSNPISFQAPEVDLGPCCACGAEGRTVRNIIMLQYKAPEAGTGWGCATCGLAPDGALAVICDACFQAEAEIQFAILGYATNKERIPIDLLKGDHAHDLKYHPEAAERLLILAQEAVNQRWQKYEQLATTG